MRDPVYRAFKALLAVINSLGLILPAVLILAMMALIVVDILMRQFVGRSTQVATEMSGYMLVAVTFLSASYSLRTGSFIRVTVVYDRLPAWLRQGLQLLFDVISCGYAVVLAYLILKLVQNSYSTGVVSSQVSATPQYIPQSTMLVGLVLLSIALLAEIACGLYNLARRLGGS